MIRAYMRTKPCLFLVNIQLKQQFMVVSLILKILELLYPLKKVSGVFCSYFALFSIFFFLFVGCGGMLIDTTACANLYCYIFLLSFILNDLSFIMFLSTYSINHKRAIEKLSRKTGNRRNRQ